jgi:hypothetical protein
MAEAQQQKFVDHYNRGDFGNASITYWEIVMNGSALGTRALFNISIVSLANVL